MINVEPAAECIFFMTVDKEDLWTKPDFTTIRASVNESACHLKGVCELTDLFFKIVNHATGFTSFNHACFSLMSNRPTIEVTVYNNKEKAGWTEAPVHRNNEYGEKVAQTVKISMNPELEQMKMKCNEAVFVETIQKMKQPVPDKLGASAYVIDTIREFTLTLKGGHQSQTFHLEIKEHSPIL